MWDGISDLEDKGGRGDSDWIRAQGRNWGENMGVGEL